MSTALVKRVPVSAQRRRVLDELVRATRDVMTSVATTDVDDETVTRAAALLREADTVLSAKVRPRVHPDPLTPRWRERARAGEPVMLAELNPLRFPLRLHVDGTRAHCTMVPSAIHEGPPGLLHGGWSAAIIDHLLGIHIAAEGLPAMTARLDLSFLRGIELDVPIRIELEVLGRHGRKVTTSARIVQNGADCVRAEGLFVTPSHMVPEVGP